jgi:hypothetical protein
MNTNQDVDILAETENFVVWRGQEEDSGYIYHLELGGVSLHLLPEEWEELVVLFGSLES